MNTTLRLPFPRYIAAIWLLSAKVLLWPLEQLKGTPIQHLDIVSSRNT